MSSSGTGWLPPIAKSAARPKRQTSRAKEAARPKREGARAKSVARPKKPSGYAKDTALPKKSSSSKEAARSQDSSPSKEASRAAYKKANAKTDAEREAEKKANARKHEAGVMSLQKLNLKDDDPFLGKTYGEQLKITKQMEKELGDTGPGRFFGDHKGLHKFLKLVSYRMLLLRFSLKEVRAEEKDRAKAKELDRIVNTLEDDMKNMTAALDTKGTYCKILDSYLAQRTRAAEEQKVKYDAQLAKLRTKWDDKYEKICKELKHWKDEANFKHGDVKRKFQEEAEEMVKEWAAKEDNVSDEMAEHNLALKHEQDNLKRLGKKGKKVQDLLKQVEKKIRDIKNQLHRGGKMKPTELERLRKLERY